MDLLNVQENVSRPNLFSSIWSLQVQMQNETNPLMLDMPALFGVSASGSQQSLPDCALIGGIRDSMIAGCSGGNASIPLIDDHNNIPPLGPEHCLHHHHNLHYHHHQNPPCETCYNTTIPTFQVRSVKSLSDLKSLMNSPSSAVQLTPQYLNLLDSPLNGRAVEDEKKMEEPIASTSFAANHMYPVNSNYCAAVNNKSSYNVIGDDNSNAINTSVTITADNEPVGSQGNDISRQQRNINVCAWLQKLSVSEDHGARNNNSNYKICTPMDMDVQQPYLNQ